MFKNIRMTAIAFLLLVLSVVPATTQTMPLPLMSGQDQEWQSKVTEFLETNQELRKYYNCRFTGEFRSLPENLQAELEHAFPKYKFFIANMEVYLDPPTKKHDLILVTDAESGTVVSFVWFFSWTMPSASFEQILLGDKVKSKEETLNRVKSLAELIVYTGNGKVGKATLQKGKITVEMLNGEEVFRILEVKIDKESRLGRLTIRRQDGRKIG